MDEQPEIKRPTIQDKEMTAKNLKLIHDVMAEGIYPGRLSRRVEMARTFVENMHGQLMADLESDPEYQKGKVQLDGTQATPGPTPQEPAAWFKSGNSPSRGRTRKAGVNTKCPDSLDGHGESWQAVFYVHHEDPRGQGDLEDQFPAGFEDLGADGFAWADCLGICE